MEEKFEIIRERLNAKFDDLLKQLDTVYAPRVVDKTELKTIEANIQQDEKEDLRKRHMQQEEALKQQEENN